MKFTGEQACGSGQRFFASLLRARDGEFLCFLETIAFGLDVDHLGNKAIDERDDAGRVREDLVPLGREALLVLNSTGFWVW